MSKVKRDFSTTNKHPIINYEEVFKEADLNKFCIKKIYRLVYLVQADDLQTHYLRVLATEGKIHSKISNVHFVLFRDIRESIFEYKDDDISLPKHLIPVFHQLKEEAEPYVKTHDHIPSNLMAKLIKLQIMMTMYNQYKEEVKKMFKRKALEEEMLHLCDASTFETKTKGKGKGKGKGKDKDKGSKSSKDKKSKDKDKKSSKDKDKKSTKSKATPVPKEYKEIDDYTTIKLLPIAEIIDHNIYNQEMFFVITGKHV